jgi:polysaccharide chain length determinant protein (PEP-CTERM system associated)
MNIDGGLQISDLGGVLRRRAKAVAATALAVLLVVYWVAMALPNVYTSYATVLVEPQAVSGDLVKAGVAQSDINQRLHLMTAQILARPRMSRIIDELGLYKEESEYLLREELIDLMRQDVRVEPVVPELEQRSSRREIAINEFKIFYDSVDPVVARDVAQRLANDFIETHINGRVQTSQKSLDFIEGELERLSKRVREVETEIAQVKADNSGTLPEELDANQRRLERVLSELAAAQRNYDEAQGDQQFFESQLATAKAMGGVGSDDLSPVRRLELLKLELSESLARGFTDKHPDVIRAREEIAILERKVKTDEKEEKESALMSPMEQQLSGQARRAALRAGSSQGEIERLSQIAEELQTQLNATPAVAKQLDALKIEYEHLFNTFQDFAKRHNEATVQAQLERRQLGEQFRVLEPAFLAPEPSAPNRLLILVLGIVFSLMLGVGIGILLEALDTSPHDARQLQNRLALPVLASIPAIWLESDRLHQHRARTRTALATAAVVMFALVGGAANYMWVNGAPRFMRSDEEPAAEEAARATESAAKGAAPKPVAAPAPAAAPKG